MKVAAAVLVVVVILLLGALLWWLFKGSNDDPSDTSSDTSSDNSEDTSSDALLKQTPDTEDIDLAEEFNLRHKIFFKNMIQFISSGKDCDLDEVKESVNSLCKLVCPSNSKHLGELYMEKVSILVDTSKTKKDKLSCIRKISEDISKEFSCCIDVDVGKLAQFYNISNALFIVYGSTSDSSIKDMVNCKLFALVDKLTVLG